ncbi:19765_t:CDS:2 [Cetraspora pellucida]|uniref:19765_t:CDS:1 n=1 Tax=Cetraspora pellucida TaxID=1433469 RepID=A0A9N8ZGN2_9GLOM|nr:19765_t:CDS:2 [Cetraspora pellucida]
MLLAICIICREIFKNPEFYEWLTKHTISVVIVSLLSLVRIECLRLLDARTARFGNLNAPFSKVAKGIILWGVICFSFICDIPQLVIQIIYRSSVINYNIIPFLTLIMGVITISQSVMIVIFNSINVLKNNNSKSESEKTRSISNGLSNIQQQSDINIHRSSIKMGLTEDEIESCVDDGLRDVLRRVKSCNSNIVKHCAESRDKRTKSWDQLIRTSREFNKGKDCAVIKKIEKEKRVSIIENRNTIVEEKGIIISLGNIDGSESSTINDNMCTSIMVEGNTKSDNS